MTDLWDYLKTVEKPIVLYGMGNGADKIIKVLDSYDIKIQGIFASDNFVREKFFHGFKVEKYSDLKAKLGDMVVLLCFGSSRPEVIENVIKISNEQELYAPDVPVVDGGLFNKEYIEANGYELEKVYNLLVDDLSKKTFQNIVKYKISGDIKYLFECQTDYNEPFKNILKLSNNEVYLDLGAYNGDTVLDLVSRVDDYKDIIAVEPDKKTFKKLLKNTENLKNIKCLNYCVSDYCGEGCFDSRSGRNSIVSSGENNAIFATVDSIVEKSGVSYINMDIEGQELKAIKGAEKIIKKNKPKMLISCYHRVNDLITIPNEVFKIREDYKLYMRHFVSTIGWDTVYYFI